jgi:hypothetical protein
LTVSFSFTSSFEPVLSVSDDSDAVVVAIAVPDPSRSVPN